MKKSTRIWIIISASLILAGIILFGGTLAMAKLDFTKLSTRKFETTEYSFDVKFENIYINASTADVIFEISDSFSVACFEDVGEKHSVEVKNNTLTINENTDKKNWYEYIGISANTPKITVFIPEGSYGSLSLKLSTGDSYIPDDLKFKSIDITASTGDVNNYASCEKSVNIKTSTGNITVENISAASLDLSVSTGKITATDVTVDGDISIKVSTGKTNVNSMKCKNFTSSGNTGNISMTDLICENKLSLERSTGDIKFVRCDSTDILVITDTGDVTGSFLSEKIFFASSDTGNIDVPKSTNGGKCDVTTDTGDIEITVEN